MSGFCGQVCSPLGRSSAVPAFLLVLICEGGGSVLTREGQGRVGRFLGFLLAQSVWLPPGITTGRSWCGRLGTPPPRKGLLEGGLATTRPEPGSSRAPEKPVGQGSEWNGSAVHPVQGRPGESGGNPPVVGVCVTVPVLVYEGEQEVRGA